MQQTVAQHRSKCKGAFVWKNISTAQKYIEESDSGAKADQADKADPSKIIDVLVAKITLSTFIVKSCHRSNTVFLNVIKAATVGKLFF